MARQWTRRQVLGQIGIATAAIHALDPHELCCAVPAYADTHTKDLFELKKVADGVYAAIAAPQYKVNSNAAVIVTNDGIVVVDSHSKPSAARSVYQEVQAVTKAPVRKIVNTHFHWDHWQGGREIQLHLLGRAHTNGDLFIYLPKEKVVVTGDALIDWMPFLNDGYPEEWVQTLTALEKLDFTHIIPGHGDVQPKSHLTFFRGYLTDLIASVKKAAADGASLDEMKGKLPDQLAPKYEASMSKHTLGRYRDRVGQNIEMVYQKVVKKA
jgi:glyoxylase-like metal-dependent hydrolase (beta-lactamase superfamily II)